MHLSSFNFYFHLLTTWNFAALIFLHFFTFHLLYTKNCYPHGIVTHLGLLPTWDCYPLLFVTHFNLLPTLTCYPHSVVKHLYQCSCFTLALIFFQFSLSFVNDLEPRYPLYLLPTFICYQFTAVTLMIYLHSFLTFICYPLGIVTHLELLPTLTCYPLSVVKHLYHFSCYPLALIFFQFFFSFVNKLEPCCTYLLTFYYFSFVIH